MRTRIAAAALLVALAGCAGGHSPGRDERAATRVVEHWLTAMGDRDDAAACALLTARLQDAIDLQLRTLGNGPGRTCRTYAARWAFPPSPVGHRRARIERLRVHGATGSVLLSAPDGLETRATLRKEHGRWRVDNYQ